jgi:hypothetical protein
MSRAELGWLLAALLLVAAVHLLLLRPGHTWSDDFAMYLAHAQNLATGRPYGLTGYTANPWAVPGPATYPPVYPLLITPLVARFGLDLAVLKQADVLMLVAGLGVGHLLLRARVGRWPALVGVLLIGLGPYALGFCDEVRSDPLFLLLFLWTLLLGEHWIDRPPPAGAAAWGAGLALGLLAYLAYGTRSVGIVLLPAVAVAQLWRHRRLGGVLPVAVAVAVALTAAQALFLHSDRGYAKLLTLAPHTLLFNGYSYLASLSLMWGNGLSAPWSFALRLAMFLVVLALAAIGFVQALRRRVTVLEIVCVFYLVPLLVYDVATMIQPRYMLPLFPIVLAYAWAGLAQAGARFGATVRRALLMALAGGAAIGHVSAWATLPRGEIRPGFTDEPGRAVLAAVRDQLPANAKLLVGRARVFALYGHRETVSPYNYRSDAQLWQLIRDERITHLVLGLGPLAREMDFEHPDDLARFAASQAAHLRPVFANSDFAILAVTGLPAGSGTP